MLAVAPRVDRRFGVRDLSRRGIWGGVALAIAFAAAMGWWLGSRRPAAREPQVATVAMAAPEARATARELVAALFPKGSTPASRARAMGEGRTAP